MTSSGEPRYFVIAGATTSRLAAFVAAAIALLSGGPAVGGERFTVCSITINSADEIRTFRKELPASQFDFVELTDTTGAKPADGKPNWLAGACLSGVQCDVLVLSGHFSNTYLGSAGTTFAGDTGLTLPLEDLSGQSCAQSCPGILANPLEVFLLGCRTLATSLEAAPVPPADLLLLSSHHVPPRVAERMLDEISYGGEDTSNVARMRFVFSGVPRIYGFTAVAPIGKEAAPRLAAYLHNTGDYAKHLAKIRAAREGKSKAAPNRILQQSFGPSTFLQSSGLDATEPEHELEMRACLLETEGTPILARLEQMEKLLHEADFLANLRAMGSFFQRHDPSSFGAAELAVLERIRGHTRSREVVTELVQRLENPILRQEILRVSRAIGWISEDEGLRLQRQIVLQLLEPPIYGKERDLICGIDPDVTKRIGIRAADVPAATYKDEYGIQALGCLKPSDPQIHERLARSLVDPREWIARLAAIALAGMDPLYQAADRPTVK